MIPSGCRLRVHPLILRLVEILQRPVGAPMASGAGRHKPSRQPKEKPKHQTAGQVPVAAREALPPNAAEPPGPEQQRADQVREEGNRLYRAGNYEEAIPRYTSAIGSSSLGAEHGLHSIH